MTLPVEVPGRTSPFAIRRKPFLLPWEASAQLRLQAEEVPLQATTGKHVLINT